MGNRTVWCSVVLTLLTTVQMGSSRVGVLAVQAEAGGRERYRAKKRRADPGLGDARGRYFRIIKRGWRSWTSPTTIHGAATRGGTSPTLVNEASRRGSLSQTQ